VNLKEVVDSLEAKDIQLAIDLGVHTRCLIDSNCPKAIELRKLIGEAGVGLPEILEGYQAMTAPDPINWSNDGFQIDGKVTIRVAGRDLELDLTQEIEDRLTDQMQRKLQNIRSQENRIRTLGQSLHNRYLDEIAAQRRTEALPQLSFPQEDLIRFNIMVSSEKNNYIFLSPSTYRPEYIVRDGIRYELSPADKKVIRRDIIFKFIINREGKFIQITHLDMTGNHFQHYHSRNADCWGQIELPQQWDRSLGQLDRLKIGISNALVTINYNSLVQHEPPSMPAIDRMLSRATELGREGRIEGQPEVIGTRIGTGGTRWGRRE